MSQPTIDSIRHSLSHVLAMAVLDKFPDAKLAIGPTIENGFYYDFDLPRPIVPEDLPELEEKMRNIIKGGIQFACKTVPVEEARALSSGQPYKLELIEELAGKGEDISFYTSGTFTDLCKGPHVASTQEINPKSFTLSHAAGAYWRGSEKNPMLQRIYGLAFNTPEELKAYIQQQEEAKKRDHRILGPQLGIFMFSEYVGAGLPLWLPNGETIKYLLTEYMRKKEEALGYRYVSTPVLAHEELYKRSGHAQYYSDDMYSFTDKEGAKFFMKPMNCPHHHMMYEKLVTSYRDLPLKLAEGGGLYRNELSGTLTGLIRVRGAISQNDSHIYVAPGQLKEEFMKVLELFRDVYTEMKIKDYWFRLSLPDFESGSNKYGGDQKLWEQASQTIRECLEEFGTPFVEAKGEAAFYGPKLDVQIKNVTGKEDTIATSQVDILVPKRMDLTYVDETGTEQHPIIIHRAILGSYERFTAFLIEQTAGNLPLWLAPVQVKVISVSDQFIDAAVAVAEKLQHEGIRVEVDSSSESVGKKIRNASMQKVPVKIVVGQKESDSSATGWTVSLNWRQDYEAESTEAEILDSAVARMKEIIESKR